MPLIRRLLILTAVAAVPLVAASGASASGCASHLLSHQQIDIIYGWKSEPFSIACSIHQFGDHETADFRSNVECPDGEIKDNAPTPCWEYATYEGGDPEVDVFRKPTAFERRIFPGYHSGSASGKRVGMQALIDAKHGMKGVGVPNSGVLYIHTGDGPSYVTRTGHNGDLATIFLRVGTTYAQVKNPAHVNADYSSGLPTLTGASPEARETYLGAIAVAYSLRHHAAR